MEHVLLCKSGESGRWPNDKDPTGWWMSEKLDGIRSKRVNKTFLSRYNNSFPTPTYFSEGFPDIPMDGELWLGYKRFEETSSIVRNGSRDNGWNQMTYKVFDIPDPSLGPVEKRWAILEAAVKKANRPNLVFVPQVRCQSVDHFVKFMTEIMKKDGEGIMLRKPGSLYEFARSNSIFKFKRFLDDEAKIVGYEEINVKTSANAHLTGAVGKFICQSDKLFNGQKFKVGSGLTDALRLKPPPIGTLITFRYQEVTGKSGVPRHARFVAVRDYE